MGKVSGQNTDIQFASTYQTADWNFGEMTIPTEQRSKRTYVFFCFYISLTSSLFTEFERKNYVSLKRVLWLEIGNILSCFNDLFLSTMKNLMRANHADSDYVLFLWTWIIWRSTRNKTYSRIYNANDAPKKVSFCSSFYYLTSVDYAWQLTSVIFNRTEYAYLFVTILALLSCLLSAFSPLKRDLGRIEFIVTFSFSRHVQHLLFHHETTMYVQEVANDPYIWSASVELLRTIYSFEDNENPYVWLISIGVVLRILTFLILYIKSEYRSRHRFWITHWSLILQSILSCEPCQRDPHRLGAIQI
jgi:hypothetical protein